MNGSATADGSAISESSAAGAMPILELRRLYGALANGLKWITRQSSSILTRGVDRRLRVAETVSLGEKRFVSILQVDGEQFLVGGSSSNVVLLAKLETSAAGLGPESFGDVLSRTNGSAEVTPARGHANEVTR